MKKLGFGLMRLPLVNDNFSHIDKNLLCKMIDAYLEKGFHYFDTAWFYHNGQSEAAVKECLAERYPRSAFLLADKMPLILIQNKDELEGYFNTQLARCGVDYFDYYLIHDMGGNRRKAASDTRIFEFLTKKKADGLVKQIGFSFHDTSDVLDLLLTEHPEVDFVQIQLNYLDWVGSQSLLWNRLKVVLLQISLQKPKSCFVPVTLTCPPLRWQSVLRQASTMLC